MFPSHPERGGGGEGGVGLDVHVINMAPGRLERLDARPHRSDCLGVGRIRVTSFGEDCMRVTVLMMKAFDTYV